MGIMKRTSADAMKDATGQETQAAELEAKATDATATIERMETESVDAIVGDPRQAEKLGAGIAAQQRTVHAFTAKAAQHRAKATEYKREALELEAAELHREADKLAKQADRHTTQVDDLLAQLKALDALEYGPKQRVQNGAGDWVDQLSSGSVSAQVRRDVESLRIKADHNRYYLATGRLAFDRVDLNTELGSSHVLGLSGGRLDTGSRSDLLAQMTAGMTAKFSNPDNVSNWEGTNAVPLDYQESKFGRL